MKNLNEGGLLYYSPIWGSMIYGNIWFWTSFHVALGFLSLTSSIFIIIWFYLLLLVFIASSIRKQLNTLPVILAYIIPVEVIGRMTKATPFIPHEMAKYLGGALILYGIYLIKFVPKGSIGKWILVLSIPAVFVGLSNKVIGYEHIVGNYLGIFNLALSVILFSNLSLQKEEIINIFKIIYFPSLSILTYVFIRSPDFDEVTFILASNAQLSGGFGANQVSTILGMGFGVTLMLWILKIKLFPKDIINLGIPILFLGWSLLSFSRGGVISAVISVILVIILVHGSRNENEINPRKINITHLTIIVLLIGGGFWYVNELTGNQLLLRYQGETPGTLAGLKERNVTLLTSGRWDILKTDLEIWSDHFIFGSGVGMSSELRPSYGIPFKVAAHTEVSRLIGEHGLLGVIISLLFLFTPVYLFFKYKGNPFQQAIIVFCMTLAVITSFHAAMRTFLTPFFYGLAFTHISASKKEKL